MAETVLQERFRELVDAAKHAEHCSNTIPPSGAQARIEERWRWIASRIAGDALGMFEAARAEAIKEAEDNLRAAAQRFGAAAVMDAEDNLTEVVESFDRDAELLARLARRAQA
jgi:hypothetical protein